MNVELVYNSSNPSKLNHSAIFKLPNGSCLRFRLISKRDSAFFRTFDQSGLLPKPDDMVLGLDTARHGQTWDTEKSSQQVICADFDELPGGFQDWKTFRKWLTRSLSGKALVTTSRNNKAKAFFVITIDIERSIGLEDYLCTLEKLLVPELYSIIDKSYSSITSSLLNKAMVGSLVLGLPALGSTQTVYAYTTDIKPASSKPLRSFLGTLPKDTAQILGPDTTKGQELVLRVLLETKGLIGDRGFDLTQSKFSELSGITQQAVSKLFRKLVASGDLICIDSSFAKGVKSKTYKAGNVLKRILQSIHGEILQSLRALPKFIPAGQWYKSLWKASYQFIGKPAQEFTDWVKTLPMWERKKTRIDMAKKAMRSRDNYLRLSKVASKLAA